MTDDTLLRRVADDLEIRSVVARLAQYADGGDLDDYVELFTEDAFWNMPGAPRRGRDDIRAGGEARRASGEAGPGSNSRHMITTITVDVDGSDAAVADSYWLFYVDTAESPTLKVCGSYRDTFRRTPSGWKLARRDVSFG
ncbi:nuclear transport factor 2 family protein [Rhabdothermincola salaria]|uniref:nuclear transport factor 2 family protein n=1 Tax=Rhabdothermincola salaria TaxID=2903142 RepID=UPI001E40DC9A|nr:nuclear transport factor 2 family protein [Rhabdothermincola salaria]MCD9622948.1 nuclear transport factor 2 family protein [Rhabdothermincola salaria]